ncbi:MAG: dihydropteroate synthase [Verrucomicrobiota bacterium]
MSWRGLGQIMGIVNINDDSFSGDGTLDIEKALDQAARMAADGADMIDVGAESARTNREAVAIQEEVDRLIPFIDQFRDRVGAEARLSINTWRPEVVEAVLKTRKVDLINDIGGLVDPINAELCARYGASLLIMHTIGEPKVPHLDQLYDDVWIAVESFFHERVDRALRAGLSREQIILDPGIDFAKQRDDNLAIYRNAERLRKFDLPILLPISRKTVIGDVLGIENPAERDAGTIACLSRGLSAGADWFRVHHVKAAADAVKVLRAIQ